MPEEGSTTPVTDLSIGLVMGQHGSIRIALVQSRHNNEWELSKIYKAPFQKVEYRPDYMGR